MNFKSQIGLIIIFLIVGGYFLVNSLHYGESETVTGYGEYGISKPFFFPQLMAQTLYLILAGAGISFLAFFSEFKKFKLFWLVIFGLFFLICYTKIAGYGVHGRYVDCLVPLMLIGALGYQPKKNDKLLLYGFGIALFSSVALCMFYQDTINTFSNIYVLIPNIQYIYIVYIFLVFLFLLFAKDRKKIVSLIFIALLVTFTVGNVVNFQYLNQASDNGFEANKIGKYINDNNLNEVVFDYEDYRDWWASYCLLNYCNKRFIPVGNESDSYFISSKTLSYEILVTQERFFELEENQSGNLYLYYKDIRT